MLEKIRSMVQKLPGDNANWRGINHINRVYNTAMKFSDHEGGNREIIGIAALLHDADDEKIVGLDAAKELANAKNIMAAAGVEPEVQREVLEIIRTIGFSNALSGIRPKTLEGRIVSDADMCDSGASGIIRITQFGAAHKRKFFDRNIWPRKKLTVEEYKNAGVSTTVNHMFEKILRLREYMLTESGKIQQSDNNYQIVSFLRQYFIENDAQDWIEYLDKYLAEHSISAWKK